MGREEEGSDEGPQFRWNSETGSLCSAVWRLEDMYIDFYRFVSIGSIVSSPAIDKGVVYFGSMEGMLYAVQ
jgi:hypothetical protein